MKLHQPSGLRQGLPLLISSTWTTEQAVAVIELLNDLGELILARYESDLCAYYAENNQTTHQVIERTDPPF